jgi:hypothetical protein
MNKIMSIVRGAAILGLVGATLPVAADENCCPLLQACLLRSGCMENLTFETAEWVSEHYLEDC